MIRLREPEPWWQLTFNTVLNAGFWFAMGWIIGRLMS